MNNPEWIRRIPEYKKNIRNVFSAFLMAFLVGHIPPQEISYDRPQQIPILLYHHISSENTIWDVSSQKFDEQMAYLQKNGFHTVTMSDYVNMEFYGEPVTGKPVVITFDDGYEDMYTNAVPILQKYGFTGTFYIITGFVDKPGYLTWNQLNEMIAYGEEIGSHTVHHYKLPYLSDRMVAKELSDSKEDLEDHESISVTTFAYPMNEHDQRTIKMAEDAGYQNAVIVDTHSDDKTITEFNIPRITITAGESMTVFERVTAMGYVQPKR